jgi:hypothetical protein
MIVIKKQQQAEQKRVLTNQAVQHFTNKETSALARAPLRSRSRHAHDQRIGSALAAAHYYEFGGVISYESAKSPNTRAACMQNDGEAR